MINGFYDFDSFMILIIINIYWYLYFILVVRNEFIFLLHFEVFLLVGKSIMHGSPTFRMNGKDNTVILLWIRKLASTDVIEQQQ